MRGGEGARASTSATRGRRCHGTDAGFGLGRWAPRRNALQVADGLTRGGRGSRRPLARPSGNKWAEFGENVQTHKISKLALLFGKQTHVSTPDPPRVTSRAAALLSGFSRMFAYPFSLLLLKLPMRNRTDM